MCVCVYMRMTVTACVCTCDYGMLCRMGQIEVALTHCLTHIYPFPRHAYVECSVLKQKPPLNVTRGQGAYALH